MIARASQADTTGKDRSAQIIKALEGWSFQSVKGKNTIRAIDHALIQPMFQAKLVKGADGKFLPEYVKTVDAVTPSLRPMND